MAWVILAHLFAVAVFPHSRSLSLSLSLSPSLSLFRSLTPSPRPQLSLPTLPPSISFARSVLWLFLPPLRVCAPRKLHCTVSPTHTHLHAHRVGTPGYPWESRLRAGGIVCIYQLSRTTLCTPQLPSSRNAYRVAIPWAEESRLLAGVWARAGEPEFGGSQSGAELGRRSLAAGGMRR